MFKKINILSIASLLLLSYSCSTAQTHTFSEALKLAKEHDKMIIVDVYTDWCGWCKKMDKESYNNSEIKKILEDNFILVRLDAEGNGTTKYKGKQYKDSELAAYFQVTGFPTTVFLNSAGKVIEFTYDKYKYKSLPGYYSADEFKKVLEYFKNEKYKDTDLSSII
jgi:thioredoxin-related protein